jgi:hypothetical protein
MEAISRRYALTLAAGGAAAAPLAVAAQEAQETQSAEETPQDWWRAWAVTKGKKTRLFVEGIYNNGGPGKVVVLTDADPQGINPKILILNLKTAKLPGVWPTVLQPIPGHYEKAPYKQGQYDSIDIHYPDGSSIQVAKITDAGAGPT